MCDWPQQILVNSASSFIQQRSESGETHPTASDCPYHTAGTLGQAACTRNESEEAHLMACDCRHPAAQPQSDGR